MSQWGKRDRVQMSGTLVANLNSTTVVASDPNFVSANVVRGDSLMIANVGYKVANVVSNTQITLDATYEGANAADLIYFIQQDPKDLRTHGWGSNAVLGANTVNARNVYGVDRDEIDVPENKARGIGHTGWVHYRTHGTSQGGTRRISEVLVAMSKNFNANATGTLNLLDSNDDTVVADYRLYFLTQPSNQSNSAGNVVIFSTAAASDPEGATLAYAWYESTDGTAYTVVNDGGDYSGNTTNTLSIANVSNVDGYSFKLTVSSTNGGTVSNTSTVATATEV